MAASLLLFTPVLFGLLLGPSAMADSALFSDSGVLFAGHNLTNGRFDLAMHWDCNLVLYENGNVVLWQSDTAQIGLFCRLKMESYGQIVIYSGIDTVIYINGTKAYTNGLFALVLRSEGSLGICGPSLWSSKDGSGVQANRHKRAAGARGKGDSNYILYSSDKPSYVGHPSDPIPFNTPILENEDYIFYMRSADCSLVINETMESNTHWQTPPSNHIVGTASNCLIQLKPDGELFVGDTVVRLGPIVPARTYRIWGSGVTADVGSYICVLRDYGDLIIYGLRSLVHEAETSAAAAMIKMVDEA